MIAAAHLEQNLELAVTPFVAPLRLQGRDGEAAGAADLTALHGETDILGTGIAEDQLGLGADEILHSPGHALR